MPRCKNPKPQQVWALEKSDISACVAGDGAEMQRSLSDSITAMSEKEGMTGDSIISEDGRDCCLEKGNADNEPEKKETENCNEDADTAADPMFDKPKENSTFAAALPDKSRRFSSPSITSWLERRFIMSENAYTSASEIIKLYEKEYEDIEHCPLHSYQVGQLLRKIFPDLHRCKITINGKRVGVYKHLRARTAAEMDLHHNSSTKGRISHSIDIKEEDSSTNKRQYRSLEENLKLNPLHHERKQTKNSGILYKLLYPHPNDPRFASGSTFRKTNVKFPSSVKRSPPKNDESIIQWLRDNYEYADGYFVKSLNVLKKYNQGRQTEVRYLSQVGRIIKQVFPHARHLRRSLKGGKREWIYHNIRPKDHTENDVWKGSRKNLSPLRPSLTLSSRPSLVPISRITKGNQYQQIDPFNQFSADPDALNEARSLMDGNGESQKVQVVTDTESFHSEDENAFNVRGKLSGSNSSPNTQQGYSMKEFNAERNPIDFFSASFARDFGNTLPYQQAEENEDRSLPDSSYNEEQSRKTLPISLKTSYLEAQINKLKKEDAELSPDLDKANSAAAEMKIEPCLDEAQDFSVSTKSRAVDSPTDNLSDKNSCEKKPAVSVNQPNDGRSSCDSSSHSSTNYPFIQVVDSDLRVKNYVKPNDSTNSAFDSCSSSLSSFQMLNGAHGNAMPSHQSSKPLQWEDLSMCDAHRFGWTLTPTLNNEVPSNYIEWVLFEGQLLRDGQRVFRELKIYDDWSVAIHAMGKKVHPDELGGITDLTRTKKSVTKVFSTLANARSCHGLPALCLSDLCVHGVVVAKTEIWSSRENNCEELRHRAINCQVLYLGNDDSCPKCYRVIRTHSQSGSCFSENNGYPMKDPRFSSRPSSSM